MDGPFLLAIGLAYLLGSVDFAVIVARRRGVDIYQAGSGNPGASNVMRTLGRREAAVVLVGDVLKGVVASAVGLALAGPVGGMAAGFAAVVGHCYPIFHRFRGGKGVATTFGALLTNLPAVAGVLVAIWVLLVWRTRTSSIGSLTVAVLAVPLAAWWGAPGDVLIWLAATMVLVIYRHRGNIARLLGGSEQKVTPT